MTSALESVLTRILESLLKERARTKPVLSARTNPVLTPIDSVLPTRACAPSIRFAARPPWRPRPEHVKRTVPALEALMCGVRLKPAHARPLSALKSVGVPRWKTAKAGALIPAHR